MNIKHLAKTGLLVATIAMSISACKKEDLLKIEKERKEELIRKEQRIKEEEKLTKDDPFGWKRPYDELPPKDKILAFLRREFKLKSIIKNNIDVTSTFEPKEQLDNTFYMDATNKVIYSFGAENAKEFVFPKGDPDKYGHTRFSQYANYELMENGVGYLTLANYLLDSGEPGLIEFEVLKFEKNELILRRIENDATIDRVFSVSEELEKKPEIYYQ